MATSDFPEIPSTEELMREADAREVAEPLQHSEHYRPEENVVNPNEWDSAEVEKFRDRPYMNPIETIRTPINTKEEMEELKRTYSSMPLEQRRRPIFDIQHQTVVELSPLVKAYARFSMEQSMFLELGANMNADQYQKALRRYSGEQSLLIRAQAEALRQAGIL